MKSCGRVHTILKVIIPSPGSKDGISSYKRIEITNNINKVTLDALRYGKRKLPTNRFPSRHHYKYINARSAYMSLTPNRLKKKHILETNPEEVGDYFKCNKSHLFPSDLPLPNLRSFSTKRKLNFHKKVFS